MCAHIKVSLKKKERNLTIEDPYVRAQKGVGAKKGDFLMIFGAFRPLCACTLRSPTEKKLKMM